MNLVSHLRHPKRLLAAAGVTALNAIPAGGGSPGSIGANSAGFSDGTPGDTANFSFGCSTVDVPKYGNCRGTGTATLNGVAFKTLTASGATFDGNGRQCLKAPCPDGAETDIKGQAQYGPVQVGYSFAGKDYDPSTSDQFRITITPKQTVQGVGIVHTFSCDGCVEVVMEPGKIPNSVFNTGPDGI